MKRNHDEEHFESFVHSQRQPDKNAVKDDAKFEDSDPNYLCRDRVPPM